METSPGWKLAGQRPAVRTFFMIGITEVGTPTFPRSVQTLNLRRGTAKSFARVNAVLSLALCLLAVWIATCWQASLRPRKGN